MNSGSVSGEMTPSVRGEDRATQVAYGADTAAFQNVLHTRSPIRVRSARLASLWRGELPSPAPERPMLCSRRPARRRPQNACLPVYCPQSPLAPPAHRLVFLPES